MAQQFALYRKYRGRSFKDIIGQDHIVQPLKNAISGGRVSHAYLFTGPHGVGKTSVARIVAHSINDISYNDDSQDLDIIEIDAASNRRIDEVRDLRQKVHIAPVKAKYKVYIIDEVHMLTREAFNALLKTLEEPPKHVVFILATTEAHKLPSTIISRTQRHSFRPIKHDDIVKHLKTIAKKESISIDDEAIDLVARHGQGSFRDSISLLDQVASLKHKLIKAKDVEAMLGLAPQEQLTSLYQAALDGDSNVIVNQLETMSAQGISAPIIASQLIGHIRQNQSYTKTFSASTARLIDDLLRVSASPRPEIQLELSLLRQCLEVATPEKQTSVSEKQAEPALKKVTAKPPETPRKSGSQAPLGDAAWQSILRAVKQQNNALYAVLRMAEASSAGEGVLALSFRFEFHRKRAMEAKNKSLIASLVETELGNGYRLEFQLSERKPSPVVASSSDSPVKNILDTFGGGEVLNYE